MLIRHYAHPELEIIRWLAILALASALALAFAGRALGAPGDAPRVSDDHPVTQQTPPAAAEDDYAMTLKLWRGLELLEASDFDNAKLAWSEFVLPDESDSWRLVALGVAHLKTGDLTNAADRLQEACRLDVTNPVAAYFLGVVRVAQAAEAMEWYDSVSPRWGVYVAWQPDVAPNSKSMYLRVALEEFQRADALASHYDGELRLLDSDMVLPPDRYAMNMPLAVPSVGHLVEALGATDFHGRTHLNLGHLYLLRDALEMAEDHLDQASLLGVPARDAYLELGERCEKLGRPRDAIRVNLKAMRGGPIIGPTRSLLENFGELLKNG